MYFKETMQWLLEVYNVLFNFISDLLEILVDERLVIEAEKGKKKIEEKDIECRIDENLIRHYDLFCKVEVKSVAWLFTPDGLKQLQTVVTHLKLSGGMYFLNVFT